MYSFFISLVTFLKRLFKSVAHLNKWVVYFFIVETLEFMFWTQIFFKIYFIDYAITVVPFFSLFYSSLFCAPPLTSISPHLLVHVHGLVVHISSLASPFPTLFLPSPCLFSTYHSCFLFPVPFPSFSPLPLPADNPPCDFHFCDSVPVLVVSFWFFFFVQLLTVVSLW